MVLKLQPIKRKSLVEDVVDRIRGLITDGHFGPGDRLPTETELIQQMQVSRTVLREAIGRLEIMGLVDVRGSRGMFVGEPTNLRNCVRLVRSAMTVSPRELIQFVQFRKAIECEAARYAAVRATPDDVAELERLCQDIRRPELSYPEAYALDLKFHRKLLELMGNELVRNVMDVVQEFMLASIQEGGERKRDADQTYRGHRAIVDAVGRGDADAAEKAMRAHLDSVLQALEELEQRTQRG